MKRGIFITKLYIFLGAVFLLLLSISFVSAEEQINSIKTEIESASGSLPEKSTANNLTSHTQVGAANYLQMLAGLVFIVAFIFSIKDFGRLLIVVSYSREFINKAFVRLAFSCTEANGFCCM